MGLDAKLRYNSPQLQIIQTTLYSFRKLCPQVKEKLSYFVGTLGHQQWFDYYYSELEAKDLILNIEQGSAREDVASLSPDRDSPLQQRTPTRTHQNSQHRYQTTGTRSSSSSSTSFGTPISVPEDVSDTGGGPYHHHQHIPADYQVAFPTPYGQTPDDPPAYHYQQEVAFYQQQYQETPVGSQDLVSLRPYSASSSSCGSSESDHSQVLHHHLHHLHNLHPAYCADALHDQHFPVGCFGDGAGLATTHTDPVSSAAGYAHDYGPGKNLAHAPPGYTSVIVDTQQYQLANEFVH